MNEPVLHLLDTTTTPDGLEMLATLLEAQGTAAHRVVVIGHTSTMARAIAAGVPAACLKHVHSMGSWDPAGWRAVGRLVRQERPACIHAWGFRGMVAATVLPLSPLPRIATFTLAPAVRQARWLRRMTSYASWVCLATSELTAHRLSEITGRHTQIMVVPPGIRSRDLPDQNAATLRKALGIEAGDGPIILLGGENGEAGSRQIWGLWASAIVRQIYPRSRLLIHPGSNQPFDWGQDVRSVRQLAATAPNPEWIMYGAPELHWRDVLQVADLMVVTPEAPISISSVLWAMAAGVPIVATSTPQMAALIEHGRTGLLAPPSKPRAIAARIDEMLNRPDLAATLRANARTYVCSAFSAEAMVAQLARVYAGEFTAQAAAAFS